MKPIDCIARWRDLLTEDESRLAIALIEQYAAERVLDSTRECMMVLQKALFDPLSRDEKLQ